MTRHAKASTAGSNQRQAGGLGRFFRGVDAGRGSSPDSRGSGAPSRSRLSLLALAALALCGLVAMTASVASGAAQSTEYVRSFGPDGTEGSDFEGGQRIGVDQESGAVYVFDGGAGALYKFAADGTPLPWGGSAPYIEGNKITGLPSGYRPRVAVDSVSHVVYFSDAHTLRAFQADGEAAEFTAGPGAGTDEIPGFGEARGVAVDANGAIYVSDYVEGDPAGTVNVFASTGEPLNSFEAPQPGELAVAPDGVVYVVNNETFHSGTEDFIPSEFPVTPTTEYTLGHFFESAIANTAGPAGLGVDSATGDLYVLESGVLVSGEGAYVAGWVEKYESDGTFVRAFARTNSGEAGELSFYASGLAVVGGGEEFQFYVGANDGAGTDQVEIFGEIITPGPPSVVSTSALDVAGNSATLRGQVNPNTFATTYRIEYGLGDCAVSACTSIPLPDAPIGSGHHPVKVSQIVTGLQPGTTYHYRIVATNSEGVTEGPDHTIVTQLSGLDFQPADNRAWEMVSPPDKHGGSLILGLRSVHAAEDGNGITYESFGSVEAAPEGNRALEASTILSRRGADEWGTKDISLPQSKVHGFNFSVEYLPFAPDLSRALVQPRDDTPLSPQASERTPYLRESTEPPTYTPLVTGKEGFENVPPGTEFGGKVSVAGANPALTDVVLDSSVPLVAGLSGEGLYRWSAGQIDPVSVLPAGEGGGGVTGVLGGDEPSVRNAISQGGSRIFWGAGGNYSTAGVQMTALYLRDMQAEESVRLDVVQPGASGAGSAHPLFQGASADGTVVFFTDSQQLTADASPAGPESRDLYRCEIPAGAAAGGCATLTDLSAPRPGSGESATVQDLAPAFSQDGSRIYFVAEGILDTEPNGEGDAAQAGEPNLYLAEEGEGVRFIATLAPGDRGDWGAQPTNPYGAVESISAAASPSGRYFAFMSELSLSGYDNREAQSEEPTEQAFRYDAQSGELACVSCNPSGASPEGQVISSKTEQIAQKVDRLQLWTGRSMAATLPQANSEGFGKALGRPRSVLDNGRVFFNAFDSLVAGDSNGEWDVYEFEPSGVGDCTASSGGASVSRTAGGCVSLISSGTAKAESAFLDTSASGNDAFFMTPARLSVSDEDNAYDVYDARVNGVAATLHLNPECLGEACQPAAQAPNDPTPSSSSFKGQGNVKATPHKRCAKGKRVVRRGGKARCVARKHRKHERHKRHHRRAGQGRRAAR